MRRQLRQHLLVLLVVLGALAQRRRPIPSTAWTEPGDVERAAWPNPPPLPATRRLRPSSPPFASPAARPPPPKMPPTASLAYGSMADAALRRAAEATTKLEAIVEREPWKQAAPTRQPCQPYLPPSHPDDFEANSCP